MSSPSGRGHAVSLLVVLLLAASSLALLRVSATLGSSSQPVASAAAAQVVRSYYASLNLFLAGGELDHILGHLPPRTPLSDPFLARDAGSVPSLLRLLALRSTFPGLQFEIVDTSVAGDLVVTQAVVHSGQGALPAWLHPQMTSPARSVIESYRIQDGQIVEQWSSARPVVLAHPLVPPGAHFWPNGPSELTISMLHFEAVGGDTGYAAVPGPGILIVQAGTLTVGGNGQLQLASLTDGQPTTIPLGEDQALSRGSVLILPRDNAVVYHKQEGLASAVLLSAVPVERQQPVEYEMDGGHQPVDSLLETLQEPVGFERDLWFGSVRVVAKAASVTGSGPLTMEFVLVIVPPGERVSIDERGAEHAVFELAGDGLTRESRDGSHRELTNMGEAALVMLIMRATSGTDDQPT